MHPLARCAFRPVGRALLHMMCGPHGCPFDVAIDVAASTVYTFGPLPVGCHMPRATPHRAVPCRAVQVVFLVGAEEGILPHQRATKSASTAEMREEERLAYVGVTRAKDHLYVTVTKVGRMKAFQNIPEIVLICVMGPQITLSR